MSIAAAATGLLTRAGGGHSFGGGGGGSGGGGLGGGGGGGTHFLFFGGGGGGGGAAGILGFIVLVVIILLVLGFVLAAQRRRVAGEPLMPPAPFPHSDGPAMPNAEEVFGDGAGTAFPTPSGSNGPAGVAAIQAHDPGFNEATFLADVERAFFTVEEAWTELKPDMSRQVMADGVWQQHKAQIEGYQHNGTRNVLDGLALGKATIINASSDQSYDTISVRLLAACADYDIEAASGKVIRGNKHDMSQWQEDWTFQRSSEATTKPEGGTLQKKCPNCGAPLDLDLAGTCKYCKAPVMSGKYDWVLSRIDQVM